VPGPLVARWRSWSLDEPRAGALTTAHAEIENAGRATWREDIAASYHWLDERGNAIVWDGLRTALPSPITPGEGAAIEIAVRAPIPPGRYGFELDLVAEHRAWFAELGNEPGPREDLDVLPRTAAVALRDAATVYATSTTPEWESCALALHAEGYAVVAGAIDAPRRLRKRLGPWAPGPGRVPGFAHPLLCPSVLFGVELERLPDVEGLPAFTPPADEPWVYDASLALTVG
jgi:hypothetical protein